MDKSTQDWSKSTIAELKAELERRALSQTGRKHDLVCRLLEHDAEKLNEDEGLNPDAEDGVVHQTINLEEEKKVNEDEGLNPDAEDGDADQTVNLEEENGADGDAVLELTGELEEDGDQTAEEIAEEQSTAQAGDMEEEEEAMEEEDDGNGEGEGKETVEKKGDTQETLPKRFSYSRLYIPPVQEFQHEMMLAHKFKSVYVYPIKPDDINMDIFNLYLNKCLTYTVRFYKPTKKTTEETLDGDGKIEDPSDVNTEEAEKTETNVEKTPETKVEELTEDESKTTAMEETPSAGDMTGAIHDSVEGTDGVDETSKEAYKGYVNIIFEMETDAAEAVKELSNFREGVRAKHQEIGTEDYKKAIVEELTCGHQLLPSSEGDCSENATYIGKLPDSVTEAGLKAVFPTAKEIRIVREEDESLKGYAFAVYASKSEALFAARANYVPVLDGKELSVRHYRTALDVMTSDFVVHPEILTNPQRNNLRNRLAVLGGVKFRESPSCQKEMKSLRDRLNRDATLRKRMRRRAINSGTGWPKFEAGSKPGVGSTPAVGSKPAGGNKPATRWFATNSQRPTSSGQNPASKRPYNSVGNSPMDKRPRQQNFAMRSPAAASYGQQRMGLGSRIGGARPRMGGPRQRLASPGPLMGNQGPLLGSWPEPIMSRPDYRLASSDYRMDRPDYLMASTDYRLDRPDYRMASTDYRLDRPEYRLDRSEQQMDRSAYRTSKPESRIGESDTVDLLVGLTQMLGNHLQGQQRSRQNSDTVQPLVRQNYSEQDGGWGRRRY